MVFIPARSVVNWAALFFVLVAGPREHASQSQTYI